MILNDVGLIVKCGGDKDPQDKLLNKIAILLQSLSSFPIKTDFTGTTELINAWYNVETTFCFPKFLGATLTDFIIPTLRPSLLKKVSAIKLVEILTSSKIVTEKKIETRVPRMRFPPKIRKSFALTPYQQEVYGEFRTTFLSSSGLSEQKKNVKEKICGATIVMPCGQGKTLLALYIAKKLRTRTLVIVPRDIIASQWVSEMTKIFKFSRDAIASPQPPIVVGTRKTLREISSSDFCISTSSFILSLLKRSELKSISEFGLIIYDEVHHMGAKTLVNIPATLPCQYSIGLTATPTRLDRTENVFYCLIGPPVEVFSPMSRKNNRVEVVFIKAGDKIETQNKTIGGRTRIDYGTTLANLIRNEKYNSAIILSVKKLIKEDERRSILILSDRVGHLRKLGKRIDKVLSKNCPKAKTRLLVQSTKSPSLVSDIQDDPHVRVVLSTYIMASEGFNVTRLNSLILATPRRNGIEQAVGRVLRQEHDLSVVIADFYADNPAFWSQKKARKAFYLHSGYSVKEGRQP